MGKISKQDHARRGWIGVDLDGSIAHYDGWRGETHIGDPIPKMIERVRGWLLEGRIVKIFTARVSTTDPEELAAVKKAIKDWTLKHVGRELDPARDAGR